MNYGTIIDANRNIVNAGTISSGAITSSGNITSSYDAGVSSNVILVENTNTSTSAVASYKMKTGASSHYWQMFTRNNILTFGIGNVADYVTINEGGSITSSGSITANGTGNNYFAGAVGLGRAADSGVSLTINGNTKQYGDIFSSNFNGVDPYQGYYIGRAGSVFNKITATELHVKTFIADLEQALAGSQIISKSVAKVYADYVEGTSTRLIVESFDGYLTMAVFANGDTVRFRDMTRVSGGIDVVDYWVTVVLDTSYGVGGFDSTTKTQAYIITEADQYGQGTTIAKKGTLALDYGTSGNGIVETVAVNPLGNSPFSQIATWTTAPYTDMKILDRRGDLAGLPSTNWGMLTGIGSYSQKFYAENNVYIAGNLWALTGGFGGSVSVPVVSVSSYGLHVLNTGGSLLPIGTASGVFIGNYTTNSQSSGIIIKSTGLYGYGLTSDTRTSFNMFGLDDTGFSVGDATRYLRFTPATGLTIAGNGAGVTNINGSNITTGQIKSTNWTTTAGSQLDLVAGTIKLGGSTAPNFSVDASGHLVSTSADIANFSINTNSLISGAYADSYSMVSMNRQTIGNGTYHWNGTNLGKGFQVNYKSSTYAHTLTFGEILTDANGNGSSTLRSGWYGIQMLAAAGNSNPTVFFQLGGNSTSYKNIIANWNFDFTKLTTGSSSLGMALNTSSTPFLNQSTGVGFEVWDYTNPKMFIGSKTGDYLDWNSKSANKLTISGEIISSKISTSTVFTGNYTFASIQDTGNNPRVGTYYYDSINSISYYSELNASNSGNAFYAYRTGGGFVAVDYTSGHVAVNINGSYATRWRGNFTSGPTTDLRYGDIYYNTSSQRTFVYTSGGWK